MTIRPTFHFPNPIKAVVFDMDGLLFDTEVVYLTAMQQAGRERGIAISRSLFISMVGLPPEHTYTRMRAEFGSDFPAEDFHGLCQAHFLRLLDSELRLKPGVVELLDLLDRIGLPRGIATSSRRASVDHHLAHFGLAGRFDTVTAHGDYPHGKPHPAPYRVAAGSLGIAPANCLALEDSYNGVRSAAAAEMMTVMVPDMLPATEEMRGLALHVVRDLVEVRDLLER